MANDVAILGLGTMGSGMAANLLKAGFPLVVYNRSAVKAQALVDAGARLASTPAEAARNASVVISMLADDAASRGVWTGQNGALETVNDDTILIESSTVSPAWIAELATLASLHGAELLDAPITGSRMQAETGQLSFLVGGNTAALEIAAPVLRSMSKEIIHLGPVGSGAKMKLINNFLCGVQVASLAEGLVWIERSGLDPEKALSILKAGAPGSPLLGAISARMTTHNYSVNFLLKLMTKDLLYAEKEAAQCKVDLKTAEVARGLFEAAVAKGFGGEDMASVIEPLRDNK
ncbi:NAD(P)-binding domain-containing protein [Granulicella arctica]|uniref:3-hydroxyisobutyrate dehydrogenase n=1 Tax=Granulicella arctica TaxID=940613 RepID=A0A7Y9PH06_9BACT|nr:3-hydroxyisobutyrate dehydrogenase [Granulicella arctica]